VADHGSYNITTYINKEKKGKEKEERKRKVHYNEVIIELLLLSDFFMEEKSPRIELKEDNEMA